MKKLVLLLFTIILFFSCKPPAEDAIPSKPNILFLFTDDQTFHAVRALGNEEIHTPNMDRLVNEGTAFTHAYNMGGWNGAICVASRSMMISGRYLWRANQFKEQWRAKDSMAMTQTWGRIMARAGYDTYMSGKWHVLAPANEVFDEARHIRPGMPRDAGFGKYYRQWREDGADVAKWNEHMPPGYNRPLNENDNTWTPADTSFGGFWQGGKHWSEVLKDDALDYLKIASQKDEPFFMYLASNAPHDPRQAPQSFVDQYPLDKISLPKNWQPEYPYKDSMGNSRGLRDEALGPFPRTEYATKVHIQEYYAIVTHLDQQIGEILDALEASGKKDNTIIFFTADHGLAVGRHGFLGKQNMYDHSVRVPLVVAGPGIPKGKKVDADVYLQDVMATSLQLAGIEKPDFVEFNSLLDLAQGKTAESSYKAIYGAYVNLQRMIRKDGFKLIVYPKIAKLQLFDVINDPEERYNLADKEEFQGKVKSLLQDLIQLQKDMDDELDLEPLFNGLLAAN